MENNAYANSETRKKETYLPATENASLSLSIKQPRSAWAGGDMEQGPAGWGRAMQGRSLAEVTLLSLRFFVQTAVDERHLQGERSL